jgi:prepilin-type N-terminal cleavage/methylation domain-containing protein
MPSRTNNKGLSLVEVLISLVILLIVSMGLIQASLLSIDANLRNELRDEAVKIASEDMARRRSSFGAADTCRNNILRPVRNNPFTFTSSCSVHTPLDTGSEQVTLTVTWSYRGQTFTHSIISIVRNQ